MAQPPSPTTTVTNPRIAKLIELEVSGRIKPQHQQELDTYRAQGWAPKKAGGTLTEAERTAGFLATRVAGSAEDIKSALKQNPSAAKPEWDATIFGWTPTLRNMLNSADRQRVENAQLDVLDAALALGTGAAYTKEQLEGYRQSYFPQLWDEDATVADKQVRLKRLLESAKIKAGGAAPDIDRALAAIDAQGEATPSATDKPTNWVVNPGGEGGDIGFASRDAAEANSLPEGAQQFQQDLSFAIARGDLKTPEDIIRFGAESKLNQGRGFVINPDEAKAVIDSVQKGGGFNVNTPQFQAPDISDVRGQGGLEETARAFARGAPAALGLDDELLAMGDTLQGGTLRENLARERAIRDYDEENNFLPRLGGSLATSFLFPSGAANAARSAGISTLRARLGMDAARSAARSAYAGRLGLEGAGLGALYGVGSADGSVGDRLTQGAVGGVTGGALGYGLGRLGEVFTRGGRTPPPPPTEGEMVAEAAARQGVELLPADVGGPMIGRMTAGTAQSPYGVTRIVEGAQKSVESLKNARNRLAGDTMTEREIGEAVRDVERRGLERASEAVRTGRDAVVGTLGTPQDITGAGQIAQRGARQFISDTSDRASMLYGRIPIERETDATVANTRGVLAEMTRGMKSNPQLSALFSNPKFKAYLDALTPQTRVADGPVLPGGGRGQPVTESVGGRLSWGDLSEFRTRIGDMLDDPRLTEGIAPRQLRALYGAVSRDMEATARAKGPDAYRAWKRANDYYDGRQKRIERVLSMVLGQRKDATANEAYGQIERLVRDGAGGDFARFGQLLRSLPSEDARAVRATLVSRAGEGQPGFSPKDFAKAWDNMSDRSKSYLLPEPGQRELMNEAANRALDIESKTPLSGLSGEDVFSAIERMATSRPDARRFQDMMQKLSPDDATALRSKLIKRMGEPTAANRDDVREGFSPQLFLTRWNEFSNEAKDVVFGKGELRDAIADLASIANAMKNAQRYANTSSTAGAISVGSTNAGLAGAVGALLTGHPLIAAGLASPAVVQNVMSRVLTSPKLVRWLTRASKDTQGTRSTGLLDQLSSLAKRDATIRAEAMGLQQYLQRAMNDNMPKIGSAAASPEERQQ